MLTRLRKRMIRRLERRLFAMPADRFVAAFRRNNGRTVRFPIEVAKDAGSDLIAIRDGEDTLVVGRPVRVRRYREGIAGRFAQLTGEYFLDRVPIADGDVVIDVGANIGEVTRILAQRGAHTISVEPEPVEAAALARNIEGTAGVIVTDPLWSEACQLTFYSKNESGDSSLIEIAQPDEVRQVQAITLDQLYRQHAAGRRIRLLKLEAEGAEPEILDGARAMLPFVDYVTADVGPERGMSAENTVIAVYERLHRAGFAPIAFGHKRQVMLFRNVAVPSD